MTTETVEYIVRLRDNFSKRLGVLRAETKQFDSSVLGLNKRMLGLGASFGAAFTATKIIQMISQHEQALAELSSITGVSGKGLEELSFKASMLGMAFGTSGTEIVKSMSVVGSKMPELLGSASALAEVTKQVDIMSKASGMDAVKSADALTKAMNIFGFSAEKAAYVNDVFATSAQKGTAPIDALADAMVNVGPAARAMGFSFEDTNILLQMLAKGGLEGVDAGTKLKMVLSKMAATGKKEFNPQFTSLKDIIKNLTKETGTTKKAMNLFGQESWSVGKILTDQASVVEMLDGNLNVLGSSLEMANTNTDTLKGNWDKLTGAFENFITSIVNGDSVLSDFLSNLEKGTTQMLQNLTFDLSNPYAQAQLASQKYFDEQVKSMGNLTDQQKLLNYEVAAEMNFREANKKLQLATELAKSNSYGNQDLNIEAAKRQAEIFTEIGKRYTETIGNMKRGGKTSPIKPPLDGSKLSDVTNITAAAPKVFNINIENLVETFNLNTKTMGESVEGIKKQIIEVFVEAINDTQIIANS